MNDTHRLVTIINLLKELVLLNTGTKARKLISCRTVKYMYSSDLTSAFLFFVLLMFFTHYPSQAIGGDGLKDEVDRFQNSLVFDEKGVPYYNYSRTGHNSIGLQGSPHAVSSHALFLYKQYLGEANETARTYFINNANWLVNTNMLKNDRSFSTYEFSFSWRNGNHTIEAPWRNAMVNGEAIGVLAKAYQVTGNKTYLDTANRILNSFYISVKNGGVTYKTPSSGWWYEEYASRNSAKEPRVLNGMIHAIMGINEYYKSTNDTDAKYLLKEGILALKNDLPKYDYNGTSFYDRLGLPANSFYKSFHVFQLKQLYELTHEPIFKIYHDKWSRYNILEEK